MPTLSDYEDLLWCSTNKFGSGVAKAMIWRIATGGWGLYTALDYTELADYHEFSVNEIREAVAHLVAHGFARVDRDLYGVDGDVLLLLSPGRIADEADERAKRQAKAAKEAAKVALRGGQINRAAIPKQVRAAVYERDNYTCRRCGATDDLTLDHVHPWSIGGSDTEENLQVLCRPCNSSKGDRLQRDSPTSY